MKRIISIGLFLISSICLVAQTTKKYTLTFDEEDFSIIKSEHGDYIISDNQELYYNNDISLPAIPYLEVNILLPENCTCNGFSYNINDSISVEKEIVLKANSGVVPTNQLVSTHSDKGEYPLIHYPFNIEMMYEDIMDGYHYVALKVFPFSYNAKEKRIKYASSIELTLQLKDAYLPHPTTSFYGEESIELTIKNMVVNPEEFYIPKHRIIKSRIIKSGSLRSMPNDTVKYLIVTSETLKNKFQTLANWKTAKGVKAKIETVENIYNNYTGSSNQIKIKKCIYDYKQQGLEYVLLGGDTDIVPAQGCYGAVEVTIENKKEIISDNHIPTDLFYSLFDGNFSWNADGDAIVGEIEDSVSFNFEQNVAVAIARIPISTPQEAEIFIEKTINYELNPSTNEYNKMLLIGNKTAYYEEDGHSDSEVKSLRMYNNNVKAYSPDMNMSYFFDTNTSYEGGASYELNPSNLQTQLSEGFHHIHEMSHGAPYGWELENGIYSNTNAQTLQNTNIPSIILTTACHTNAFDNTDPCLSESFMKNPQSGVVAFLGSSRQGWGTTLGTFGASLTYNANFYKALFKNKNNRFGKIVFYIKDYYNPSSYNVLRWLHFSLNAIGDPELPIYTESPKTIEGISWVHKNNKLYVTADTTACTITLSSKNDNGSTYYETVKNTCNYVFEDVGVLDDYQLCFTKDNYKPIWITNLKSKVYIQNQTFTNTSSITGSDIIVGSNVSSAIEEGPVIIKSGSTTFDATNSATIMNGFECKKGAILEIK